MQRREFILLLGGVAAAWPLLAKAQQGQQARRIAVLMGSGEDDPKVQSFLAAFVQGLKEFRWIDGQNIRIEYGWAGGETARIENLAKEAVDRRPDIIVAYTTPVTAALKRYTSTIPIVFVAVSDPVGAGFVESLARPNGNITGFINIEASWGGKWLELLKEIAPRIRRAAIMSNPATAPGGGSYFLNSFRDAGRALAVEVTSAPVRTDADIEAVISELGRGSDGGLVVSPDVFNVVHRRSIISATKRSNVPAIFHLPAYVKEGGLLSYGANNQDLFRRTAGYVDRVLQGTKPSDLPVQIPAQFELVINVNTAKALGLEVPLVLQQRADELIE